jgi:hypothetical protein
MGFPRVYLPQIEARCIRVGQILAVGRMIVPWLEDPIRPPSLWKISTVGGTPHKFADEGWFPSVSPSGDQVAFVTQSATTQEIWLTQADGDNRRRLVSADSMHPIGPIA